MFPVLDFQPHEPNRTPMEHPVDQTIHEEDEVSQIPAAGPHNRDEEKRAGEGSWRNSGYSANTGTTADDVEKNAGSSQPHAPTGDRYYSNLNNSQSGNVGQAQQEQSQQQPGRTRSTSEPPVYQETDTSQNASSNQLGGPLQTGSQLQLPAHRTLEKLAPKKVAARDQISMTLGGPIIIFFDLVVPCLIYYIWLRIVRTNWRHSCNAAGIPLANCSDYPEYNDVILGLAVIAFGIGELYILIVRVVRLIKHREDCAPLLSRHWAELDATSWVYLAALIIPLIAFVVSTNIMEPSGHRRVIPWLYLYAPGFLMGFLLILMCITLIPFTLPYGINSDPRGTKCKPFVYYAAEDFIAVDGWQGRAFRERYKARYENSKMFRNFFFWLQIFWICGASIYIGCLSAVIWTLEFEYAFGVCFGLLFTYLILWAGISYVWMKWELHREKKAFEEGDPNF
ncbi:hypothetical protein EG328_010356 [Venturia inaequalis]|uniref:Uncharacterized protein n=2 Tax=Venturia inaequalis TaxID=5025 RepID=A0A8H3U800_VENIN|nr:hypothetical protein EG328_010356 [Venturia inaequalis]RDI84669.1 hypothetical protein Vi05172_g5463 [Venturia inaequalis]